eukprot:547029-Alexandrium_andersonii.AAC.1
MRGGRDPTEPKLRGRAARLMGGAKHENDTLSATRRRRARADTARHNEPTWSQCSARPLRRSASLNRSCTSAAWRWRAATSSSPAGSRWGGGRP